MGSPDGVTPGSETLLANYINGSSLPAGYNIRTVLQEYHDNDIEKRNIKLPPADMAFITNKNAEFLLRNGYQGQEISESGLESLGASTISTINSKNN